MLKNLFLIFLLVSSLVNSNNSQSENNNEKKEAVIELTENNFEEFIAENLYVLVKFYARTIFFFYLLFNY